MDDTSKKKENKYELETSLSTEAVIKLGTRPSPPPRPMNYSTIEPTPTHTTHKTRNTRLQSKILFSSFKRALSPTRHVLENTSHQTRPKIDAGDGYSLMESTN